MIRYGRRLVKSAGTFLLLVLVISSLDPAIGQTSVWTRQLDGSATGIAVSHDGSIYVAQAETQGGLSKYDVNGNVLWMRPPPVWTVAVDLFGNVYTVGANASFRKYDTNGNQLWRSDCGCSRIFYRDVAVDGSGVYVAGHFVKSGGGSDAFLRKVDFNGRELWTRQFASGSTGSDVFRVAVDHRDGIYVAGWVYGGALPGQNQYGGAYDVFVRKYDTKGSELWTRQFGTSDIEDIMGVTVDTSGSVYVAGQTQGTFAGQAGGAGYFDAFVRKYSAAGTLLWTSEFGSSQPDFANGLASDATGRLLVVGQSLVGFWRAYDSGGDLIWDQLLFPSGIGSVESPEAVAVDQSGGIYVTGNARFGVGFLAKFATCVTFPSGDVNRDCLTNCQDLSAVQSVLGRRAGQPGWNPRADLVTDNVIDLRDLALLAQKLPAGTHCR